MRRVSRKKHEKATLLRWILPVSGLGILILGIWIGVFLLGRGETDTRPEDGPSVAFSVATLEIARQFACPCGSCGEESLALCECPTAVSAKRFIEENLDKGLDRRDVINRAREVYGHFRG
ncbi:MAG: hypothetical protein ACE5HZ_09545 [Fidelibacterota bacterium]